MLSAIAVWILIIVLKSLLRDLPCPQWTVVETKFLAVCQYVTEFTCAIESDMSSVDRCVGSE